MPSVPHPTPTVVPVGGDVRGNNAGVACTAISCGLEWDGEGRHRSCGFIHASKKLGGVGGCWGGGGTGCWGAGDSRGEGCGECKVDEDEDEDMY